MEKGELTAQTKVGSLIYRLDGVLCLCDVIYDEESLGLIVMSDALDNFEVEGVWMA